VAEIRVIARAVARRFLCLLILLAGTGCMAIADPEVTLGNATCSIPQGWKKTNETDDRLTFSSPDGRQQATITLMRFDLRPSFPDFERICSTRYQAEKAGLSDLSLEPQTPAPRNEGGRYRMAFSGTEKSNDRIFSGLLSLKDSELVSIYVEGLAVDPATNLTSFKEIVSTLKQ
jgi:hypothetical protein